MGRRDDFDIDFGDDLIKKRRSRVRTKKEDIEEETPVASEKKYFAPPKAVSCLLPVLTVCAIAAFLIAVTHFWMNSLSKNTTIPDVAGMELKAAENKIRAADLVPEEVSKWHYSEDIPEGMVISTFPKGNRSVKEGRKIHIIVSKGSGITEVPDVAGMTLVEATDALKKAGLILGEVNEEYNKKVPIDSIIESSPPAGVTIRKDTKIDIILSQGAKGGSVNIAIDDTNSATQNDGWSTNYRLDLTLPFNEDTTKTDELVIKVKDKDGERTDYTGIHNPGEKIVYNVNVNGKGTVTVTYAGKKIFEKKI